MENENEKDCLYHLAGILTNMIDSLKISNNNYVFNKNIKEKLVTKRDAIVRLILKKEQEERKDDNRTTEA